MWGENMSRTRWPLAALAVVALIGLAGCSNAPAATGTGSSSGNNIAEATATGTGSSSAGGTAANREQAMKFSKCMRDNGVGEFPDPDASGALTIDAIANGSSLDTNTTAFKKAIGACKDLEPAGFMGSKRSTQEQEAALNFAQCIRDNGVTDFPDPVNGEPLVDTNRIPSAATNGGMSILHAAMQKCRDVAAQAGVSRP
jgi:hypothetical protein